MSDQVNRTEKTEHTDSYAAIPEDTPSSGLNFGEALKALQNKKCVARSGWNGKRMFLIQAGGYSVPGQMLRAGGPITAEFLAKRGVDSMEILPHIDMWTADNKYCTGWLASQTDMQATDWEVVTP